MMLSMAGFVLNDACMKLASVDLNLFQAILVRSAICTVLIALIAWRMGALSLPRGVRATIAHPALWVRTVGEVGATAFFLNALFNMPLGIEMHSEWIADCIAYMDRNGYGSIEPTEKAEQARIEKTDEVANTTLLPQTVSWYSGANIPGKPRVFMVYLGGGKEYKEIISECADKAYAGFKLEKA